MNSGFSYKEHQNELIYKTQRNPVKICFLVHFHQPYWQSHESWEKVKKHSYSLWLKFLSEMQKHPDFCISVHLSGPFLAQICHKYPDFIKKFKIIIQKSQVSLIGGFVDEAFIQLSSRPDDVWFQLKEYSELVNRIFGITPQDFDGLHIVEREINERLLYQVAKAARSLGILPLIYLDVETHFKSQYLFPGSPQDLFNKYFGVKDTIFQTAIPFLPKEGLYYLFRDEIQGNLLYIFPMHSIFRYHLYKHRSFSPSDKCLTPQDYLKILLEEKKKTLRFGKRYNTDIHPIFLIFSDAERLGHWSGQPVQDYEWLKQLFELLIESEQFQLTSLRGYYHSQGILDTYPVKTSLAYPEHECWMANRGIRGGIFADPKLRKVYSQTYELEQLQDQIERKILDIAEKQSLISGTFEELKTEISSLIIDSPNRFQYIQQIAKRINKPSVNGFYYILNRLRNQTYIADAKWATRHPAFGTQPQLDAMSAIYLDIAEVVGYRLLRDLTSEIELEPVKLIDWNKNEIKEILIQNEFQKVIISKKGAHVVYHQVRNPKLMDISNENLLKLLESSFLDGDTGEILKQLSTNICITEPDSELCVIFSENGSRIEKCRDSYRVRVMAEKDGIFEILGDFSEKEFHLDNMTRVQKPAVSLRSKQLFFINEAPFEMILEKRFVLRGTELVFETNCQIDMKDNKAQEVYIVPEFVYTLLPFDEDNFTPNMYLGLVYDQDEKQKDDKILLQIEKAYFRKIEDRVETIGTKVKNIETLKPKKIIIVSEILKKKKSSKNPHISLEFCDNSINNVKEIMIAPAVKKFYQAVPGKVGTLFYHISGIKLIPHFRLSEKMNYNFQFIIRYDLGEEPIKYHENIKKIDLLSFEEASI